MDTERMRAILGEGDLLDLFGEGEALLFKHSPTWPVSVRALGEVQRLVEAHPDLPVYWVDVIEGRPLSRVLAERLGIVHESPQAILLRGGSPVWHASHLGVTAEAVARELRQRGE